MPIINDFVLYTLKLTEKESLGDGFSLPVANIALISEEAQKCVGVIYQSFTMEIRQLSCNIAKAIKLDIMFVAYYLVVSSAI